MVLSVGIALVSWGGSYCGRLTPGLLATIYNIMGPREHYQRDSILTSFDVMYQSDLRSLQHNILELVVLDR